MSTASGAIPPGAPTNDGAATAVIAAWRAGTGGGRALTVGGLAAVVAAVSIWFGTAPTEAVVAVGLALVALTAAALVDAAEHRLPNALVALGAVPVMLVVLAAGGDAPAGALAGAILCGGPLLVTHLVSPAGLGFGDVKAVTVLGAALGLIAPIVAVVALLTALVLAAAGALASGRGHVALGPGLVAGSAIALAATRVFGVAAW